MKRKVMRKFRIDEISAVDRPAQEGARTVIMKRDEQEYWKADFSADQRKELAQSGAALPDGSFPIRNTADLKNAVSAFGRAGDKAKVARHIASRARALGATDALPTDGEFADLTKKRDESVKTEAELAAEKNLAEITKRATDAESALALAKSIGELSDIEKSHYGTLDAAGQTAFLKCSKEDRKSTLENLAKADPVVYTSDAGEVFKKSDDPRLVGMAKRNDITNRELAKANEKADNAVFAKRAEVELPKLSGESATKIALLKAVETIKDEAVKLAVTATLKAANTAASGAFKEKGSSADGSDAKPSEQLEKLAKAHQVEKKVDFYTAYDEVAKANPELYAAAIKG